MECGFGGDGGDGGDGGFPGGLVFGGEDLKFGTSSFCKQYSHDGPVGDQG